MAGFRILHKIEMPNHAMRLMVESLTARQVLGKRRSQQITIVMILLQAMLAGCITVRAPSKQELPMFTEGGIIANEKDFLWYQLRENIDFGMTRKEVIERCGKPHRISNTANGEIWSWRVAAISSPGENEHEVNINFRTVEFYFDKEGILYSAQVE